MDRTKPLALISRLLLSAIFILAAFGKLSDWNTTAGYMTSKGMPAVPFFLLAAVLIELIGGILLAIGYKTRSVSALLFLYLIPVTLIFHAFWSATGAERPMQTVNFLKNLAILGGLLHVYVFGPGALSVDERRTGSGNIFQMRKSEKEPGIRSRPA